MALFGIQAFNNVRNWIEDAKEITGTSVGSKRALDVNLVGGTVSIDPAEQGVPFFDEQLVATTPGVLQTVLTHVVPAGTTRKYFTIIVTCRQECIWLFKNQTNKQIARGRTGPGCPDSYFLFTPGRDVPANSTMTLSVLVRDDAPTDDNVSAYIMASDFT